MLANGDCSGMLSLPSWGQLAWIGRGVSEQEICRCVGFSEPLWGTVYVKIHLEDSVDYNL